MAELTQVLRHVLPVDDPNVLVDMSTGDDAAVYRLAPDRALVVTVDFFTPIVDDPFDFGRIAAANALSDIYAMGARPLLALSLVGFPRKLLGEGLLERIVEGAGTVAAEAGIPIVGGHSIDDPEPKFGMAVIGEVHPDRMLTNAAGRAGDRLVLTKPLGTGVITTALKAGAASDDAVAAAVRGMTTLNRAASEAAVAAGVRAGTDVTGFGLLGHLSRMAAASKLSAEIRAGAVPLLPHARELLDAGHLPGGSRRNLDDLRPLLAVEPDVPDAELTLLADAQTSGGLLLAVAPERVAELQTRLAAAGAVTTADIGFLTNGQPGAVRVTR